MAPCHYASICQNGSKSIECATNLLNILSADVGLWSCHHHNLDRPRSRSFHLPKSQQKHRVCAKYMLNIPELVLDAGAVSAMVWIAPGHHRSHLPKAQQKLESCATNLLEHSCQLMLDSGAVTTPVWLAPCHDCFHLPRLRQKHGSLCGKSAERIPQLIVGLQELSPPWHGWPHVTILSPPTHHKANALPSCSYLWLQPNSSKADSILKPRKSKRFYWIQKTPISCSKSQETLPERPLSSYFQVSSCARLRDGDSFTSSTWQKDLKFDGTVCYLATHGFAIHGTVAKM